MELGLSGIAVEGFFLMGIWDHFFNISVLDQDISTHCAKLPQLTAFKSKPQITLDDQHGEFKWFDLAVVSNYEKIPRLIYATMRFGY